MEEKNNAQREPQPTPAEEGASQQAPGSAGPASGAEETQNEGAYFKDLFLRKAAELENYKKRVQQESSLLTRFANEDLLQSVLPVVDDLERSLKSGKEHEDLASFSRGIELIYQKLLKVLETQGVKPFESLGKEFDVAYHDALLQVPRADVPPHRVVEVVEPGYMYHDRVLRHAKVIVSAEAPAPDNGEEASDSHQTHNQRKEW